MTCSLVSSLEGIWSGATRCAVVGNAKVRNWEMACSSSTSYVCMQMLDLESGWMALLAMRGEGWLFTRALPLLFIMVLEELSNELRTGYPWELLYADEHVRTKEVRNLKARFGIQNTELKKKTVIIWLPKRGLQQLYSENPVISWYIRNAVESEAVWSINYRGRVCTDEITHLDRQPPEPLVIGKRN